MNPATVREQIATALDTIDGLRVFAYIPDTATPPVAIVAPAETIEYDQTMARGMDSMTIPVYALVGKTHDRTAMTLLDAYTAGSGASSFKAVLQAGTYTAFHELRVMSAETAPFVLNAVEYLGAMFLVDVAGPGA